MGSTSQYDLSVTWKCYPLEQINNDDENFKLWEQPEDYQSRGLAALLGFQAALLQEQDSFDAFHLKLLKLRHEEDRELSQTDTILEAAEYARFDLDKFKKDMADSSLRDKIKEEYQEGHKNYGAFGVPTIVFDNGEAIFVKLASIPEGETAVDLLKSLHHLTLNHSYLQEIKKPVPSA